MKNSLSAFFMKSPLYIILLLFVVVSCSDNNQRVFRYGRVMVSSVPEIETTLSPSESLSGPFLYGSYGLNCIADSILILPVVDDSHCYRAVDLTDFSYFDFMNRGRGPDEIITAYFSGLRTINDTILIDIAGLNERLFYSVDLKTSIKEKRTVIKERYKLFPNSFYTFLIGDVFLSEVLFDQDYYSLKQYSKQDLNLIRTVQLYGNDRYLVDCQPILGSVKRIKPDGTRMSMAMMDFNEINIYDISGENHLSVSTSNKSKDKAILTNYHLFGRESGMIYYWDGAVTDDYIYALYFNCKMDDMDETLPVIHVFSWDGELKALYHIDEPLRSIILSEDGHSLYGLSEDEVIYRYDLG